MASAKHSVEVIKHPLQLEEELPLHEKGWVIQRIGWVVMLLFIIAGALGLFGEGLVSSMKPKQGATELEYDRFFRYETEMKILAQSQNHIATVSLPQDYLKDFKLVRFVPEPIHNHTADGQVVYNFQPGNNQLLSIYLVPKNYGTISGTVTINGAETFPVRHFIYP